MKKEKLKEAWEETYLNLYWAVLLYVGAAFFWGLTFLFQKGSLNKIVIIFALCGVYVTLKFLVTFLGRLLNSDND